MLAERSARRLLIGVGAVGVVGSALLRFVDGPAGEPLARVMALGVAGVTPWVLATLPPLEGSARRLLGLAALMCPLGALAAVASLFQPLGPSGALISAWMVFALLAASVGLATLRAGEGSTARGTAAARVATSLGLLALPVAAGWLAAARMGARPFDLDPVTVTLLAIHLHFAVVAVPALLARLAGALPDRRSHLRSVAGASALLLVLAQPLVAMGLAGSPFVGLVGAALVAACLVGVAAVTLGWVVPSVRGWLPRGLLTISALSALLASCVAVVHAGSEAVGEALVGLEWMTRLHGFANAHGFVTCGLLAWVLLDLRAARAEA